jgi:AcrR family transcriptional regulator
MCAHGIAATTLDEIVATAHVSKSQLYRHFANKSALVRAVVEFVGERTIGGERERLGKVRSLADLWRWREGLIAHNAPRQGRYGCPLGSLASEVAEHDAVARKQLQSLFTTWGELFEETLLRFQSDGTIPADADAIRLATALLASVQGGYVLAQTARDVAPMAAAVDMALQHLQLLASNAVGVESGSP